MRKIRVLVVDDSHFLQRTLPPLLESDPEIQVIGVAKNGVEAIQKARELRPDVITLDILMPVMDGLTALKHIIREIPTPVVMLSAQTQEGARETVEALTLGAVDVVAKPSGPVSLDIARVRSQLLQKIKIAYVSRIQGIVGRRRPPSGDPAKPPRPASPIVDTPPTVVWRPGRQIVLVAIASSTGGPAALQRLLPTLPADLSAGLVIVQHIAKGFVKALAERLNALSALQVKVAEDGEEVRAGVALIGPVGLHITVEHIHGKLLAPLQIEPRDALFRPSADVLMYSAARACGPQSCGVILTGMERDGAEGLKAIKERGGVTIAQDEDTSVVFGMPRAAIELGAVHYVRSLERIAPEICRLVGNRGTYDSFPLTR